MRKAAIILPTYNESDNIEKLIQSIYEERQSMNTWEIHIVVVDSSSPDGTSRLVEALRKRYNSLHLVITKKEGLGKAYNRGFIWAIKELKPYVLIEMDADLSHDPKKINELLKGIENGADFVIGSRYMKGGSIPKNWAIHRKVFSVVGNLIIKLGFMKIKITDWTSGFRAVKTWVIEQSLSRMIQYSGYVYQVALLDNAIKSGAEITEIPIQFVDRTQGYSKINSTQYILQTLFYVFVQSAFIRFCFVGLIGFAIDFSLSYLFIQYFHLWVWLSTIISAEIAIVSNFILNNYWSFAHSAVKGTSGLIRSFIKFNTIALGSLVIQTIGMETATHFFGLTYWPLYKFLIIAFIVIPYSYIFYTKFIWKK